VLFEEFLVNYEVSEKVLNTRKGTGTAGHCLGYEKHLKSETGLTKLEAPSVFKATAMAL
jgi:hypothetical protein